MTWKTPKIVEIAVGLEINMYACAGSSEPELDGLEDRPGTRPLRRVGDS
jgi:coenzyme PQQ precursor peptide PqqA